MQGKFNHIEESNFQNRLFGDMEVICKTLSSCFQSASNEKLGSCPLILTHITVNQVPSKSNSRITFPHFLKNSRF